MTAIYLTLSAVLLLIWLIGIPIAYGIEKCGSSRPDWWNYGLWPIWYVLGFALYVLSAASRWICGGWRRLEDIGHSWAHRRA